MKSRIGFLLASMLIMSIQSCSKDDSQLTSTVQVQPYDGDEEISGIKQKARKLGDYYFALKVDKKEYVYGYDRDNSLNHFYGYTDEVLQEDEVTIVYRPNLFISEGNTCTEADPCVNGYFYIPLDNPNAPMSVGTNDIQIELTINGYFYSQYPDKDTPKKRITVKITEYGEGFVVGSFKGTLIQTDNSTGETKSVHVTCAFKMVM